MNKKTSEIQGKKARQSNFELLRILAILLVIVSHFNVNTFVLGKVSDVHSFNSVFFIMTIFSTGAIGNLIFMILTGYFISQKDVKPQKTIRLWLEMLFYSGLFLFIAVVVGRHSVTDKELRSSLFPIPFGNWFVVYYILFMLFVPFLNKMIRQLSRKEHLRLLIVSVLVFSVMPIFFSVPSVTNMAMFFVGYVIGSYIKLYFRKDFSYKILFACLGVLILVMAGLTCVKYNEIIAKGISPTISYAGHFIVNNCSIFVILTATVLFLIFKKINIGSSKIVNTVSGSVLGVYLIHENVLMKGMIWRRFGWLDPFTMNPIRYLLIMVGVSVAIFVACTLIDRLRILLFYKLEGEMADKIYSFAVLLLGRSSRAIARITSKP